MEQEIQQIENQQIESQENIPAPSNKGKIFLILGIVVVLLIIGGGVFAYFKYFNKSEAQKEQDENIQAVKKEETEEISKEDESTTIDQILEVAKKEPIKLLTVSFLEFRKQKSFKYNEINEEDDKLSDGTLSYKGQDTLEGTIIFPDKAYMKYDGRRIRTTDGKEEKDPNAKDEGIVIIYEDNFYYKDYTSLKQMAENLSLGEEYGNIYYGKYWKIKLSDLWSHNPVLVAYKCLNEVFNLNNPDLFIDAEFIEEVNENNKEYLKFKILEYDLEKMMQLWTKTDTKLNERYLLEGYNVEYMYEMKGEDLEINAESEILIEKDTLLPDNINFTLEFRYPSNKDEDIIIIQEITRNIIFSNYNDENLFVKPPGDDSIIGDKEKQMYDEMIKMIQEKNKSE